MPCESEQAVRAHFFNSLKEATCIEHGSADRVMQLSADNQNQLWQVRSLRFSTSASGGLLQKVAIGLFRYFGREMSSRGRFATPADFPRPDCSAYRELHVCRESLVFVYRSRTSFCRPAPNPNVNDSQLFRCLLLVLALLWSAHLPLVTHWSRVY